MPIYQEDLLVSPRCNRAYGIAPPPRATFRRGHDGGNGQDGFSFTPPPSDRTREGTSLHTEEGGVSTNVKPHDRSNRARFQDAFDQWGALVTREGCYAYQRPPLVLDHLSPSERETICLWCYKFVDFHDFDRATVATILSYIDRLLAAGIINRTELTLTTMTSLYLALKMKSHAGQAILTPSIMAGMSNGLFAAEDFVRMEGWICEGFGWLLNPPVALSYINMITPILMDTRMIGSSRWSSGRAANDKQIEEVLHQLVQQSRYLCERSILDVFFVDKPPSSIAHAAVSEALGLMSFPQDTVDWFHSLPLSHNAAETYICAKRIHDVSSNEGHRPAITFSDFHGAPANGEEDEMPKIRVVTPTKGAVPSSVERVCLEGIVSPMTNAVDRSTSLRAMHNTKMMKTRAGSP